MRAQLAEEKQRAAVLSANMEALSQQLAQTQAQLAEAQAEGAAVAERLAQVSSRILGRRTVPFPPFLIPYRVPHGFTQDPSTDPKILVPAG